MVKVEVMFRPCPRVQFRKPCMMQTSLPARSSRRRGGIGLSLQSMASLASIVALTIARLGYGSFVLAITTPIGRFLPPEEIADFFVFLCSAWASYSVGSTYFVAGGMLKTI
jgi:NAD(P)-dependent dehydrogenase (short-subunit alcohol dehydrogenase family)